MVTTRKTYICFFDDVKNSESMKVLEFRAESEFSTLIAVRRYVRRFAARRIFEKNVNFVEFQLKTHRTNYDCWVGLRGVCRGSACLLPSKRRPSQHPVSRLGARTRTRNKSPAGPGSTRRAYPAVVIRPVCVFRGILQTSLCSGAPRNVKNSVVQR